MAVSTRTSYISIHARHRSGSSCAKHVQKSYTRGHAPASARDGKSEAYYRRYLMQIMLLVHIVGGTLGLVSGFVALFAAKGARLHRSSGMLFVSAMLTLGLKDVISRLMLT